MSQEQVSALKKDRQIKKMIKKQESTEKKIYSIILLGSGESGKSTVMKQLRINYQNGLNQEYIRSFIGPIRENVEVALKEVCSAMVQYMNDIQEIGKDYEYFKKYDDQLSGPGLNNGMCNLSRYAIGELLEKLKSNENYQEILSQSSKYNISDFSPFFVENHKRIMDPNFFPTEKDVLHCRVTTTGRATEKLECEQFIIKLTDVGGQRCERSKWFPLFDNVDFVIFVAPCSDYDVRLRENEEEWRINDSLKLLQTMSSSQHLKKPQFILFLNKVDLLQEKLLHSPLNRCFNDYNGGDNIEKAKEYIKKKFESYYSPINPEKGLTTFFTCATDTESMKKVVDTIHRTALMTSLGNLGLY